MDSISVKHQSPERIKLTDSDLRNIIRNTLGNKCSICGSEKNLHIHHTKYEPGMTIKDLELLCLKCHYCNHGNESKKRRRKLLLDRLRAIGKSKIMLHETRELGFYESTVKYYLKDLHRQGKLEFVEKKYHRDQSYIIIKEESDVHPDKERRPSM